MVLFVRFHALMPLQFHEKNNYFFMFLGVSCSLSARTAILAAANPVDGHYNKAKTVTENLKMKPALISRFDLLFILIDRPDEYKDAMLSDHIMSMYNGVKSVSSIGKTYMPL